MRQVDDKIDFGFLRIQTDIYRVRQLMLGSTSGTRLAVSPTLATIAQGTSAASSRANLRTFYDQLKSQPATDDTTPRAVEPTGSAAGGAASVLPLSAAIGERAIGSISNVTMLKSTGFPAYDNKILGKMRGEWRYKPYMVNGKAVPVCTAVTFIYSQK